MHSENDSREIVTGDAHVDLILEGKPEVPVELRIGLEPLQLFRGEPNCAYPKRQEVQFSDLSLQYAQPDSVLI